MLRSAPRSVRIAVQLLLVAIVAGALLLYAPPIGAVSVETLHHSLVREAGARSGAGGACLKQSEGVYRCVVHGNGATEYELTRSGRRCWSAVQVQAGSAPDLPNSVSGCLRLRDQVRI